MLCKDLTCEKFGVPTSWFTRSRLQASAHSRTHARTHTHTHTCSLAYLLTYLLTYFALLACVMCSITTLHKSPEILPEISHKGKDRRKLHELTQAC